MMRAGRGACGMRKTRNGTAGWILVEMIVSLTLLAMLVAGLGMASRGSAELNRFLLAQQRCVAAARAQLDSLAVTGDGIEPGRLRQWWPGVAVRTRRAPGRGDWAGLVRLEVTATAKVGRRTARVVLCRYVPAIGGR